MRIKYLITVLVLILSLGCGQAKYQTGPGDPELIYDETTRIGGLALASSWARLYLDTGDKWTPEFKQIWTAYYAYYLGAQLSLAKGDMKEFEEYLEAAHKQLRMLMKAMTEI